MTALIGGLAGIDMISGPGMLDFLLAQSPEKLVIDADMIGMVQRLLRGVATPTETLATGFFEAAGPEGRFLELQETRKLFRSEQFLPSRVFDRNSRRAWLDAGGLDAYGRAHERVEEIMATHEVPALAPEVARSGLVGTVREAGAPFGLGDALPGAPAGLGVAGRRPWLAAASDDGVQGDTVAAGASQHAAGADRGRRSGAPGSTSAVANDPAAGETGRPAGGTTPGLDGWRDGCLAGRADSRPRRAR